MRYWALLIVGGCYSPSIHTGAPCPDDICPKGLVCSQATKTCELEDRTVDARTIVDAAPDAFDGCYGMFQPICPNANVTGNDTVTITGTQTLDTAISPLCESFHNSNGSANTAFCVIAAKSITVGPLARWNIIGTKPFVLLATDSITIDGTIDAASHRGGQAGANSNPTACALGMAAAGDEGGPGGSFGTAGGAGGGSPGNGPSAAPATGMVTTLRGGCGGRDGNGANAGGAGRGGGALYLIAETINVRGTINASGASGVGAGLSSGGGGGGSGGLIVLDAKSISASLGRIFANGGGGGEGGGGSNGGNDGADSIAPATVGAGGGNNAGGGGDGGDGAFNTTPAKVGENGTDSGGGGGGGFGVIRVFRSQITGGTISPPPT